MEFFYHRRCYSFLVVVVLGSYLNYMHIIKLESILNYFRKIDKVPSNNDEELKELLGPNVLKVANASLTLSQTTNFRLFRTN